MKKNHLAVVVLALAAALSVSPSALAKGFHKVNLKYDTVLNGTHLNAGDYQVSWESHSSTATVTFAKSKNVVATAQAKLVDRGTKYSRSSVVFMNREDGTRVIQEIRPAGETQTIVFFD